MRECDHGIKRRDHADKTEALGFVKSLRRGWLYWYSQQVQRRRTVVQYNFAEQEDKPKD